MSCRSSETRERQTSHHSITRCLIGASPRQCRSEHRCVRVHVSVWATSLDPPASWFLSTDAPCSCTLLLLFLSLPAFHSWGSKGSLSKMLPHLSAPHRVVLPTSQTHQTRTRTKLFIFLPGPPPTSRASAPPLIWPQFFMIPSLESSSHLPLTCPHPHGQCCCPGNSCPCHSSWVLSRWVCSPPSYLRQDVLSPLLSSFFFHPQTSRRGKSRHGSFLSLPCLTSSAAGDPCLKLPVALDKASPHQPLTNLASPFHNSHRVPHPP